VTRVGEGEPFGGERAGRVQRFGPGDMFVIPAGYEGTWETLEPVLKLYAIYQA
jgi:hypothetical protein